MDRKTLQSRLPIFLLFFVALAAYALCLWLVGCPILCLTGISCPGCGMTRALLAAFHGDLRGAFGYHPLFFLPLLILITWLLRKKLPGRLLTALGILAAAAMVIVYLIRMFTGSEIVYARPEEGLFFRVFRSIW